MLSETEKDLFTIKVRIKSQDIIKEWNNGNDFGQSLQDINLYAAQLTIETENYLIIILECYVLSFIELFNEHRSRKKLPENDDVKFLVSIMKDFVDREIKIYSDKLNSPFSPVREETAKANISIVSNEFPTLIGKALLPLNEYLLKMKLKSNNDSENINEYEKAITIIYNTMRSNSRVPIEFKKNDEDSYRRLLVHSLSGKFEGQVNAEAINDRGKTDIKISKGNDNILIAECKIWGGSKKLNETINQLLGYTDWYDEKTAVIVFSTRKSFSRVLNDTKKEIDNRDDLLSVSKENEHFRCLFKHPEDMDKKLNLSILVFNILRKEK